MATYSRVLASGEPYDTPCHPSTTRGPLTPSPSRSRPPETSSIVAAPSPPPPVFERASGQRYPGPDGDPGGVDRDQAASTVASEPHVSDTQTDSRPTSSASFASAATSCGELRSQCPQIAAPIVRTSPKASSRSPRRTGDTRIGRPYQSAVSRVARPRTMRACRWTSGGGWPRTVSTTCTLPPTTGACRWTSEGGWPRIVSTTCTIATKKKKKKKKKKHGGRND